MTIAVCGSDGYFLFPLEDEEGEQGYSFRCNCGYESPDWYPQPPDAQAFIQIHQTGGEDMPDNNDNGQPETVPTTTSVPTTTNVDDE